MTPPQASHSQATLSRTERDELVLSQLTEVRFIARQIHERLPVSVPIEDLVNSGIVGLLEATDKYNSSKNVRFKTYAQFRIRGAILDSLRQLDRASRCLRNKSRKLNEASEQLSMRLSRRPTEEEVAGELGLDLTVLRKLATTLRGLESVDRHVGPGQHGTETYDLIESATADPVGSPLARCLQSEMNRRLAKAMSGLSTKEKEILSMYYCEQLTMQEIALRLHLNSSRISQLHSSALTKLRARFEEKVVSNDTKL
jgi:RNA polymerase sigma factor FliA